MCDSWAERDERIKVIHKENGGLSSARNAALDIMNGEYLMFVDSDDYLALNAVERMYKRITDDNSDMAICNYICVDEKGSYDYWDNTFPITDEVIDKAEAHKRNTTSEYWHYAIACCKLYKAFLFNDIRFPEGRLHEDMFTSHIYLINATQFHAYRTSFIIIFRTTKVLHMQLAVKALI